MMSLSKKSIVSFCIVSLLLASSIVYAFIFTANSPDKKTFVTWDSLEPDKWSSIWLIKNHIDSNAIIEVRPTGDSLGNGIAFGVPQADYTRSGNQSTFESLLAGFQQVDPVLKKLGSIVTAIETTSWESANDPIVHAVEQNFRRLQDRYGRSYVPIGCYEHFFDTLYVELSRANQVDSLNKVLGTAVNSSTCEKLEDMAELMQANRVKEISVNQLLSEIALGKQVIFVDTREPEEFAKSRIPGAINIPMRDLNSSIYDKLKQADIVISYCVKDFRGYEVARKLLDNGVSNAAVMNPHGLSGWQSMGLPTASVTLSESVAREQLVRCAKDKSLCTAL